MTSVQSTKFTVDSSKNKTNRYAQLQAMGIDIYAPIQQLDVAQQPWIDKLCKILSISREDCLFDAKQPTFDNELKKLHLPAFTVASEADIKKLIWQNIRQFVT
jgi:hypothetical protein